ncbi:MAG: hypothetical protein ACHQ7M_17405 [Chloroflexota bacterium]
MTESMADAPQPPTTSASASGWARLKLIGLIVVGVILAGLGGIGVALGLMQSPSG